MIKHIVMWKFQPGKEAEARAFLEGLGLGRVELEVIPGPVPEGIGVIDKE